MIAPITSQDAAVPVAPRYRFENENDKHLHTLDGRPLLGTSTICGVIDKPLAWWAAALAAVTCLESGEHIPGIRAEYDAYDALCGKDRKNALARLQRKHPIFKKARYAHHVHKNETADQGTENHANLEKYIKDCIYDNAGFPISSAQYGDEGGAKVRLFSDWSMDNVSEFLWSEAHCYSEKLWTGGISDCGAILLDHELAIMDFKRSREVYYPQFVQCGGYAAAIKENGLFTADGAPILAKYHPRYDFGAFIVWPFRADPCVPVIKRNTLDFEREFAAAAIVHKGKSREEKGKSW